MEKDRAYYRSFNWSKYQRDIFTEINATKRNIAVEAVAGSGKSTSLKGIVHWLPSSTKIRIFAFNKAIAEKLSQELPARVKVGTAHSYGYALCMGATGTYDGGLTVDNNKYWKLAGSAVQKLIREAQVGQGEQRFPNLSNEKVVKSLLTGIYEACHIIRVALPVFRFAFVKQALDDYGVIVPASLRYWVVRLAMGCIIQGNEMASQKAVIDFDDMLWLPHLWKLRPRGAVDVLMVDECQDTTAASQALYRKFVEDGARLIIVGDTRQAINMFAGSMPDAFPKLKEEFDCVELPLPVSYRCPVSHVALAQQIVPHIEAREGAIKGSFATVDKTFLLANVRPHDLVLSRMTAALVRCCIDLVLGGVKAQIRGNDIAERFCGIAMSIAKGHPMPRFPHELHLWLEASLQNASDYEADEATDTAHALQACYNAFGSQCSSIEQFCDRIRTLFSPEDPSDAVILSTIHRAKGDEARVVWLLNSEELPIEREDWNQAQQEENLLYVGITRAIEFLYFVPSVEGVSGNVGGIQILEDIDQDALAGSEPQPQQITHQLALF